jgi:hypothetical protein
MKEKKAIADLKEDLNGRKQFLESIIGSSKMN